MLTQTMPALIQALQGTIPPDALKQLTQALGNCNQPLTHRGDVNIQPTTPGNKNGVYGDPPWPPDWDRDLIPDINNITNNNMIDMADFHAGDWNTNNYAGSQFYFPTNNAFNLNNYYGGDTTNIGGNSYFDNTTTNNLTTQNINTTTINNSPIPGAPGPAGPAGGRGAAGVPGLPGFGVGGLAGRLGFIPQNRGVLRLIPIPTDAIGGGTVAFSIPTDACKTGTIKVTLTPETTVINNVSGALLDEDCTISLASNSVTVVTGVTATAEFTPTAATYDNKTSKLQSYPAETELRAVIAGIDPQNPIAVLVPA